MYTYKAQVVKVVDADTMDVNIDLGFNTWLNNVRIRLARIDAYEVKLYKGVSEEEKKLGLQAKEYVENEMHMNKGIVKIITKSQGSFGRWISEVEVNGKNLNDKLVSLGLAVYKTY